MDILELLAQQGDDHWLPWQQKRPLLHIACERAAWNCVKYLVSERSDEINQCYDEYYPIHHAALHDIKFLELLIQCGAETTVRTSTQLMTALHVVCYQFKNLLSKLLRKISELKTIYSYLTYILFSGSFVGKENCRRYITDRKVINGSWFEGFNKRGGLFR